MTRCTRLLLGLLGLLALAHPTPAIAQTKPAAPAATAEVQTPEQLKAQQHFQRARELYAAGSYREAIGELEFARALDPKAKDLVFNMGIVHEKLGSFDEALTDFRLFLEMDTVTAAERLKAESVIKRIEGAKREVPATAPTATAPGTTTATPGAAQGAQTPPDQPAPGPEERKRGRVDAATIAAASVGAVGLGVGTVFGIRAVAMRPTNFVTGRDGTYADLQAKTDSAHTSAIIADVGLGVGLVGAVVAAYLYFGRTKDAKSAPATGTTAMPAVIPGGGALLVGGSFR